MIKAIWHRKTQFGFKGQVIMEYLIIFAVLAFVVTLGSAFFQNVMTGMEDMRNRGINIMINR